MTVQPTQNVGISARLNPSGDTLARAFVWGMASTVPNLDAAGFAPTLNDALFQAFASAIKAHPFDFLGVYCPDEAFTNLLAEFNPYEHVRVNAWSEFTSHGRLARAAGTVARDRLVLEYGPTVMTAIDGIPDDHEGMPPLMIATDGSHSRTSSAWAWITESGLHGSGAGRTLNPLAAEILAIKHALKHAPKKRPVILLSDSKWAISHARRVQQDPKCSAMLECQGLSLSVLTTTMSLIRKRENVTYKWVKGHAGNPLNEAADRLAVHTRRCHEGKLELTADVVASIVTDMMDATAFPLKIAS